MTSTDVRVREWLAKQRDELVNMTRRNRLLYFKHTKTSSLEISSPDPAEILDRLNRGGAAAQWSFHLPAREGEEEDGADAAQAPAQRAANELLIADKDADRIGRALRNLERKANQEFVDKGLWVLYVGLGILNWRESQDDGEAAASPLFLVPVTVARDSLRESFRLRRTEDDPVVNPALAIKLESDFGFQLPSADDFEGEGFGNALRTVEEFAELQKGWSIGHRAVLAPFTFQKEAMYRDLLDNEDRLAEHPMMEVLALGPEAPSAGDFDFDPVPQDRLDQVAPPEKLVSVLDADSTQRAAIHAARAGRSFVMDGPPGTGKSQTITNIIAELLHAGNSVLFVSEKAAALDVVHNRLEQSQLDAFVLQLHSHNATRKAVASELGHALNAWPAATGLLTDADRTELARRRESLSSYAQAMNEVREPLGRSLHHVLGRIARLRSVPQAPAPRGYGRRLTSDELTEIRDRASALGNAWGPVSRADGFIWRDLDESAVTAARRGEAGRDVAAAEEALEAVWSATAQADDELGLGWKTALTDAYRLTELLALLDERVAVPVHWLTRETLDDVRLRESALARLSHDHRTVRARLRAHVGERADALEEQRYPEVNEANRALETADPPLPVASDATAERLGAACGFLQGSPERLRAITEAAGRVAAGFGLSDSGVTLEQAARLAELGALMDSPELPEAHWLDPTRQAALNRAEHELGELLGQYRACRRDLGGVFTEAVLELDLETLHARFTHVHRGMRKLGGAYRRDKRTLAAGTVTGRVDSSVLEGLPDAIAWKTVAARLTAAEEQHGPLLGDHYYRRDHADFVRIEAALGVARRALELSAGEADPRALARCLSRGSRPDPALLQSARKLGADVASWLADAQRYAPSAVERLRDRPVEHVIRWCADAADPLSTLCSAVEHVGMVMGRSATAAFADQALADADQAARLQAEIERDYGDDAALLGDRFQGVDTDWDALARARAWTECARGVLGGPVPAWVAESMAVTTLGPGELRGRLGDWEKALARITGYFAGARAEAVGAALTGEFESARTLLETLGSTTDDIEEWSAFTREQEELRRRGLEAVVGFCVHERVPADQVEGVVERAVLEAWVEDTVEADAERLGPLRADDRDDLVDRFRALDEGQVKDAAARVINACSDRRPASTVGVAGTILREAEKKRRHMPIRELLAKSGEVAQRLKPCFMMSPLSVSQYLPPTLEFDVVIFDEASQVRPSDAVNCIYRGKRLIVAGDQKQLPPTSFFTAIGETDDDTYDDEQIDEFDSVLELCKSAGALRSLPLRWHYRSRHESLITYSNYSFYSGNLFTFPGAHYEASDMGIAMFKVDGVYRRGATKDNPVEARTVIDRVLHHRRHHPELTLGVVAFSTSQVDAIEHELEKRAQNHPELDGLRTDDRIGGFFVKSLENVQGDERDIILFSIGYGPDENGRFLMQIPHLSRAGSERRLNVAITRAKRRVEIVTSVTAGDFPATPKAPGLKHLQRYLDYADRGLPALAIDSEGDPGAETESPFEEEVLRCLRAWGYDVQPQVGTAGYRIDLGVRHPHRPGSYALAVECDGAMYHSSKTARDRDRLRQRVLEGLGWRVHRIWGTSWYRRQGHEEERLRAAVEQAIDESSPAVDPEPSATEGVQVWHREAELDAPPAWTAPYRAAALGGPRVPYDLHTPEARGELTTMVGDAVRQEGPVHRDRVLDEVRKAWGIGRSGGRVQKAFEEAVRVLLRDGTVRQEDGEFLRVGSGAPERVRVPTESEPRTKRKAEHVPPAELRLAVRNVVRDAGAIGKEELSQHVSRVFGWRRRGSSVKTVVDRAVDDLQAEGALVEEDGCLSLGPG